MKMGYIRINGVDEAKINREKEHLEKAGCTGIIVEELHKNPDAPKLEAYLAAVKAGDELIVCSTGSLSRKVDVLMDAVKTLKEANAKLVTLDRCVDFDDPDECFMMTLLQARQEFEDRLADRISEI